MTPSVPAPPRGGQPVGGGHGHKMLDGEPPPRTMSLGSRMVVQSSACRKGQVLELIGGDYSKGIQRQRRCIAAN